MNYLETKFVAKLDHLEQERSVLNQYLKDLEQKVKHLKHQTEWMDFEISILYQETFSGILSRAK